VERFLRLVETSGENTIGTLMKEDTETLAELMLHADRFCSKVEDAIKDVAPIPEEKDLRLKIGQCRNQLAYLQEVFNDGKLNIENARVRADFRQLILGLLWIAFYARSAIDFRIFRVLVMIESGFTYLLVSRQPGQENCST
jgi:hypothetical protein